MKTLFTVTFFIYLDIVQASPPEKKKIKVIAPVN